MKDILKEENTMSEKLNEIMDKINNVDRKIQGVSTSAKMKVANIKFNDPVSNGIGGAVSKTIDSLENLSDKGIVWKVVANILNFILGITLLAIPVCMFFFANKLDKQGNTLIAYIIGAIAIWFIFVAFGGKNKNLRRL